MRISKSKTRRSFKDSISKRTRIHNNRRKEEKKVSKTKSNMSSKKFTKLSEKAIQRARIKFNKASKKITIQRRRSNRIKHNKTNNGKKFEENKTRLLSPTD